MTDRKTERSAVKWYVAYTRTCQERRAAEILSGLGIESYVPIQKEVRQWSDRRKVVDKLVIPHIIFLHCDDYKRDWILRNIPQIPRCMAQQRDPFEPAFVPDDQMETFRRFVECGSYKVNISSEPLEAGDTVRVVSGPLAGCECELMKVSDQRLLVTRLPLLGAAVVEIGRETVEKI